VIQPFNARARLACFQFAKLSAFPYGKEIVRETELKGKEEVSRLWRMVNAIVNVMWFPIGALLTLVYFALAINVRVNAPELDTGQYLHQP